MPLKYFPVPPIPYCQFQFANHYSRPVNSCYHGEKWGFICYKGSSPRGTFYQRKKRCPSKLARWGFDAKTSPRNLEFDYLEKKHPQTKWRGAIISQFLHFSNGSKPFIKFIGFSPIDEGTSMQKNDFSPMGSTYSLVLLASRHLTWGFHQPIITLRPSGLGISSTPFSVKKCHAMAARYDLRSHTIGNLYHLYNEISTWYYGQATTKVSVA